MKLSSVVPCCRADFRHGAGRAVAQTATDNVASQWKSGLPDGQQLFGTKRPNVRRATAQVNGEIITGTDIGSSPRIIVAANDNKLPPEELARFRAQILPN